MTRSLLPVLVVLLASPAFAQSEIPGAKPVVVDLPAAKPDATGPTRIGSSSPIPDAEPGLLGEYVNLAIGIKGFGGANVWTEPSGVPAAYAMSDVGFAKARAGAGGGAGLYLQARFIRFIGFETGMLYEWNSIWENLNLDGVHVKFTAVNNVLRFPFLVKGILPLAGARLALAIGPEVVVPVSTSASTDISLPSFRFEARSKVSTMLTMGFDIDIELPAHLLVPIGIRASYNLTQPSDYVDRVTVTHAGQLLTGENVLYQNSWDFRFQIGLAYEL